MTAPNDEKYVRILGSYRTKKGYANHGVANVPTANDHKRTVAGVMEYVVHALQGQDIVLSMSTNTDGDVTLLRGGKPFLMVQGADSIKIRDGVFVMLAQYLIFALLHGANTSADVATMFEVIGETSNTMLDDLTKYLEPARHMANQTINNPGHMINVVLKDLEVYLAALGDGQSVDAETKVRIKTFLTDNSALLHTAITRMRETQGYLQVYVRDRPNVEPSAFEQYNEAFGAEIRQAAYPIAIKKEADKKRTLLTVYGQDNGYYSDVFDTKATQADVAKVLASDMSQLQDGLDVVLFGFGYSGSGKTYTLMGNDDGPGALAIALASFTKNTADAYIQLRGIELDEIFIESIYVDYTSSTLSGVKKTLYSKNGNADDTELIYLTDADSNTRPSALQIKVNDRKLKLSGDKQVTLSSDGSGQDLVNTFIRSIANDVEAYLKMRFRIRPTPNNMTSSRVHTYFKFRLAFESSSGSSEVSSTLTVIDMAGRESPDSILKEFNGKSMRQLMESAKSTLPPQQVSSIIQQGIYQGGPNNVGALLPTFDKEKWNKLKADLVESKHASSGQRISNPADVSDVMALLALEPTRDLEDKERVKTYEYLVKTGIYTFTHTNYFSGYTHNKANYVPVGKDVKRYYEELTQKKKEDFPLFQVYDEIGGDNELKKIYGINAPLYYTYNHVVATVCEGYYIGVSLDQLLMFFYKRTNQQVPVRESSEQGGLKFKTTAITHDILTDLDKGNTKFIMLAHIRVDRPKGLKATLEFAQALSSSMQDKSKQQPP